MKRKIQQHFKSHQKILLLILILLATLLFGFINGSYSAIEGLLVKNIPINKDASVDHHKAAANNRSKDDEKTEKSEEDNLKKHGNLDSG
jgi:hypothetical protein